jgi:hypothetical protein
MTKEVLEIDWHREFRSLDPYIKGEGRIVRVEFDGEKSAWHRFNAMLKQRFARAGGASFSIRISRHWHTTYLLEDILDQFERKLSEVGHPSRKQEERPAAPVKVLSDVEIHGDGDVSVGSVHVHGPSPFRLTERRNWMVADICARIGSFIAGGGRVMVVMNPTDAKEQGPFWSHFWRRGLDALVEEGLLFVYLVDRTAAKVHHLAPDPQLSLSLPSDFEDESRWAEAYDDMIDALSKRHVDPQEAAGAANGVLTSSKESVTAVYNNFFALMLLYDAKKMNS